MIQIFVNFCQRTKINISDSFKKAIYDLLKDYSINENQIRMTNIKDNNGKILCKGIKNLNLNFVDRPIKLNNDIKLKYNYYVFLKMKKVKLLILIERPGNFVDIQIIPKKINNMYIIQYKGKKCLSEEELKFKENMKNERTEFGEFILDIPISLKNMKLLIQKNIRIMKKMVLNILNMSLPNLIKLMMRKNNKIKKIITK